MHKFKLNPGANGGESITLSTTVHVEDEESIWFEQELEMVCYGNRAVFYLSGAAFTPENLRDLANQLDQLRNQELLNYERKQDRKQRI